MNAVIFMDKGKPCLRVKKRKYIRRIGLGDSLVGQPYCLNAIIMLYTSVPVELRVFFSFSYSFSALLLNLYTLK